MTQTKTLHHGWYRSRSCQNQKQRNLHFLNSNLLVWESLRFSAAISLNWQKQQSYTCDFKLGTLAAATTQNYKNLEVHNQSKRHQIAVDAVDGVLHCSCDNGRYNRPVTLTTQCHVTTALNFIIVHDEKWKEGFSVLVCHLLLVDIRCQNATAS